LRCGSALLLAVRPIRVILTCARSEAQFATGDIR